MSTNANMVVNQLQKCLVLYLDHPVDLHVLPVVEVELMLWFRDAHGILAFFNWNLEGWGQQAKEIIELLSLIITIPPIANIVYVACSQL